MPTVVHDGLDQKLSGKDGRHHTTALEQMVNRAVAGVSNLTLVKQGFKSIPPTEIANRQLLHYTLQSLSAPDAVAFDWTAHASAIIVDCLSNAAPLARAALNTVAHIPAALLPSLLPVLADALQSALGRERNSEATLPSLDNQVQKTAVSATKAVLLKVCHSSVLLDSDAPGVTDESLTWMCEGIVHNCLDNDAGVAATVVFTVLERATICCSTIEAAHYLYLFSQTAFYAISSFLSEGSPRCLLPVFRTPSNATALLEGAKAGYVLLRLSEGRDMFAEANFLPDEVASKLPIRLPMLNELPQLAVDAVHYLVSTDRDLLAEPIISYPIISVGIDLCAFVPIDGRLQSLSALLLDLLHTTPSKSALHSSLRKLYSTFYDLVVETAADKDPHGFITDLLGDVLREYGLENDTLKAGASISRNIRHSKKSEKQQDGSAKNHRRNKAKAAKLRNILVAEGHELKSDSSGQKSGDDADHAFLDEVIRVLLDESWKALLSQPISMRWRWLNAILANTSFILECKGCREAALGWCDLAIKCLDGAGTGMGGVSKFSSSLISLIMSYVLRKESRDALNSLDTLGKLLWICCAFGQLQGEKSSFSGQMKATGMDGEGSETEEDSVNFGLSSLESPTSARFASRVSAVDLSRRFPNLPFLPVRVQGLLLLCYDFLEAEGLVSRCGSGLKAGDEDRNTVESSQSDINAMWLSATGKEEDIIRENVWRTKRREALRVMGLECLANLALRCCDNLDEGTAVDTIAVIGGLTSLALDKIGLHLNPRAERLIEACSSGSLDTIEEYYAGLGNHKSRRMIAFDFGNVSADAGRTPDRSAWKDNGIEKGLYKTPTLSWLFPEMPEVRQPSELEQLEELKFSQWMVVTGSSDFLSAEARFRVRDSLSVADIEWRIRNRSPLKVEGISLSLAFSSMSEVAALACSLPPASGGRGRGLAEGRATWQAKDPVPPGKVFVLRASFALNGIQPLELQLQATCVTGKRQDLPDLREEAPSRTTPATAESLVRSPTRRALRKDLLKEGICQVFAPVVIPSYYCLRRRIETADALSARELLSLPECGHGYGSVSGSLNDVLRLLERAVPPPSSSTADTLTGDETPKRTVSSLSKEGEPRHGARLFQCEPLCLAWGSGAGAATSQCLFGRTLGGDDVALLFSLQSKSEQGGQMAMRVELRSNSKATVAQMATNLQEILQGVFGIRIQLEGKDSSGIGPATFLGRGNSEPLAKSSAADEEHVQREMNRLRSVISSLKGRSQAASMRAMGMSLGLAMSPAHPRPKGPSTASQPPLIDLLL